MNKILSVAVAAAMIAPLTAQADVKLTGTIQAEIAAAEIGNGDNDTITTDSAGAVANGGPNRIGVDFDEKLNSGLTAFGRVDWDFNTTTQKPGTFGQRESYVGLKGGMAHLKIGRTQGIYKTIEVIDPFYSTGAQARAAGGGMTGGSFGHSSYVNNVIELGLSSPVGSAGKFAFTVQGVADEFDAENGSYLAGLEFTTDNWGVFLAGAYHDFSFSNITDTVTGDNNNGNGKVGGWFKMGGLKLGLQYEMAEDGTLQHYNGLTPLTGAQRFEACQARGLDCTGDYIFGSVAYGMGDVTIAGTASQYMSDDDNADAFSFSLGAIYSFSKRTMAYVGYHSTDSDTDRNDFQAFAGGIRHSF